MVKYGSKRANRAALSGSGRRAIAVHIQRHHGRAWHPHGWRHWTVGHHRQRHPSFQFVPHKWSAGVLWGPPLQPGGDV